MCRLEKERFRFLLPLQNKINPNKELLLDLEMQINAFGSFIKMQMLQRGRAYVRSIIRSIWIMYQQLFWGVVDGITSLLKRLFKRIRYFLQPYTKPFKQAWLAVYNFADWGFWLRVLVASIFLFFIEIFVSVFVYTLFYYFYIPSIRMDKPLYFNFKQLEKGSEVKAESRFPDSFFYSRQEYDVSVAVDMPESNPNIDLGVFMVQVDLYRSHNDYKPFHSSIRPTMLRHKSWLVRMMRTWLFAIPLALGLQEEKQYLYVPMIEQMEGPFERIVVSLSKGENLQLYSSEIVVEAHLSGIRYLCYYWFFTSFVVGTTWLTITQSIFWIILFISWRLYSSRDKVRSKVKRLKGEIDEEDLELYDAEDVQEFDEDDEEIPNEAFEDSEIDVELEGEEEDERFENDSDSNTVSERMETPKLQQPQQRGVPKPEKQTVEIITQEQSSNDDLEQEEGEFDEEESDSSQSQNSNNNNNNNSPARQQTQQQHQHQQHQGLHKRRKRHHQRK